MRIVVVMLALVFVLRQDPSASYMPTQDGAVKIGKPTLPEKTGQGPGRVEVEGDEFWIGATKLRLGGFETSSCHALPKLVGTPRTTESPGPVEESNLNPCALVGRISRDPTASGEIARPSKPHETIGYLIVPFDRRTTDAPTCRPHVWTEPDAC